MTTFQDDEIREYALDNLDLIDGLKDVEDDALMDELEYRGYELGVEKDKYNIVQELVLEKLYKNLDNIPMDKLEKFIDKHAR